MSAEYMCDLSFPDDFKEGKTYPAIFVMHGAGSNEKDLVPILEGVKGRFILFFIRGNIKTETGYKFFDLHGIGNPVKESFDRSVQGLTAFIKEMKEAHPIDKDQVYLLGFSQGAIMAMTLALTLGDEIRGIVAMNGYIPSFVKEKYSLKTSSRQSVYISHGESDPIFPIHIGNDNQDYFMSRAVNTTYETYPAGHFIVPENVSSLQQWLLQQIK
ncbi:dienelactone hydrolase family protein [Bacillus sp. CECT 9360]|uniref:alpha/beta hydrolase n=1 Tax=Bacillus sp. CECT 9360 TaxID=2845821 RepID=UPI001E355634|nr:dienelactone hydrolase family protein [Bacillus sp. CECT 9360]CAH0347093.1 Carboxylesterase 2 [Bacillus sp. CECT 9360]